MKIIKGRTAKILTKVYTDTNLLADITGSVVTAIFKKDSKDSDALALFSKSTLISGVTLTNPTQGECQITINGSDTNNLSYQKIYFEVVVKLANNDLIGTGVQEIEILPNILKTLI